MCTRPLVLDIDKPRYRHILGTRSSIIVPCGRCPQCLDAKVDSLYQRNYLEYENCKACGGYGFFDTLTYSPKYIPVYNGKQYFRSIDLTSTMKRLRSYLAYSGFKDKVKFFFVSEYGDTTERIHGHIIFYVYDKNLSPLHLHNMLCKAWKYGFCDSVFATMEHVLTSPAAIKYIMKYITKSFEYERLDDDEANRCYRPFYRASINLGFYPEKFNYTEKLRIGTIRGYQYQDACFYFLRKIQLDKSVDLEGQYIKTENGSYTYHLNPVGLSYRAMHIDDLIEFRMQTLQKKFQLLGDKLRCKVVRLMDFRDVHDLAVYDVVYRGVAYNPDFTMPLSFNDYKKDYIEILTWQLKEVAHSPLSTNTEFLTLRPEILHTYNYICSDNSFIFKDFDEVLSILTKVDISVKTDVDVEETDHLHSINRLKRIMS